MKQERKNINVIKSLSRDASSVGDSSFGSDYHRDSPASVPFVWESEPGTPKHKFHDQGPLPPLTPPPSYTLHSYGVGASRQSKPTNLIHSLFPRKSGSSRKGGRDINMSSSSASSSPASPLSSQWSSSSSLTTSTSPGSRKCFHGRRSSGQRMTSFDSRLDEEEEEFSKFPVSGLFYSVGDGGANRAPYRGCCSAMMKIFKG